MPLISVIIPTRNRAEFLPLAISSVLAQTFQDFEIIVVDDASQDNTAEVVNSFKDNRIKLLRNSTCRGGSAARNTAILHSKADVIAFLDDDDEWFPEKLRLPFGLLDSSPRSVGVIYTGYLVVERGSGRILHQRKPLKRGDLSSDLLDGNCIGGTSIVLGRKECFEKAGLFDERLPSYTDYDLWIRISRVCHFDFIKEPMSKYYVHKNQIWTNYECLEHGMQMMLAKHGYSRALRKYLAGHFLSLGVKFCENDSTKRGRQTFLRGIQLNPLEVRHYFNFLLSLLGSETFKRVKRAKENVLGQESGRRL